MRKRKKILLCICMCAVWFFYQIACVDVEDRTLPKKIPEVKDIIIEKDSGPDSNIEIDASLDLDIDSDSDSDTDLDTDTDSDSDADSDLDSDADADSDDENCSPVNWGSGFDVGKPVANWQQTGYIDSNGDGTVETNDVPFSLEDLHCSGKQSMVLVIGVESG